MTLRLNGATSGYVEIDAPAAAGSNTLVLPTGNGTNGQALQTNGSGALSWGPGVANSGQLCKAWVNFDGTNTPAIRASYNVSSITDDGVGLYRVNFTAALTDANYCVTGSASNTSASPNLTLTNASLGGVTDGITPTTSAVRVRCTLTNTGSTQDAPYMCVAIFR